MSHIHLNVFVYNLVERRLGHLLYHLKVLHKVFCTAEDGSTLRDGLGAYLTSKVVEAAEDVGMYLLEALDGARLHAVEQAALDEGVGFLLALSVDGVVAIHKPVKEGIGAVVGVILGKCMNTRIIKSVSGTLLTVGSPKFELVSDTNQLDTLLGHLAFQVFPIVAAFFVVYLIVNSTHDIRGREPPLAVLLVPYGTHLVVIIKTYGYLVAHDRLFRFAKIRKKRKCVNAGMWECVSGIMYSYIFPLSFLYLSFISPLSFLYDFFMVCLSFLYGFSITSL